MRRLNTVAALIGLCVALAAFQACPLAQDGPVLRFVALGDQGTGDARQAAVAASAHRLVQERGAEFLVLLGDNFYPVGVSSVADPQWQSAFESMYGGWGIPVYPVLGNHDYGGGAGSDDSMGAFQVAYTGPGTTWTMPSAFYRRPSALAELVFIDSNWIVRHGGADLGQADQVRSWLTADSPWRLAFGHHPYLSNGTHGNAGAYDASADPMARGENFRLFFDQILLGKVDVYFSGHDHNLQDLPLPGGYGHQVVSGGGGASLYPLVGLNAFQWQAMSWGFVYVELRAKSLDLFFFDQQGNELFHETLLK